MAILKIEIKVVNAKSVLINKTIKSKYENENKMAIKFSEVKLNETKFKRQT